LNAGHLALRSGLMISMPWKSFSFVSDDKTHPFAPAMAATIMSRPPRGRPLLFPSAISRAQISPAFSSNARDVAGKEGLRALRPREPCLQLIAFLPAGFRERRAEFRRWSRMR